MKTGCWILKVVNNAKERIGQLAKMYFLTAEQTQAVIKMQRR